MIGSITYIQDYPNFDLPSDDASQIEINFAGSSLADLWEEDQFLQRSNEPVQTIYDTDDESFQSLETFSSKDEEERNKEIFEQVETKEPSHEKEEEIEHNPAQEYNNLLIEYSPLNQSLPRLQ